MMGLGLSQYLSVTESIITPNNQLPFSRQSLSPVDPTTSRKRPAAVGHLGPGPFGPRRVYAFMSESVGPDV